MTIVGVKSRIPDLIVWTKTNGELLCFDRIISFPPNKPEEKNE
jgi:hypothetical protein